MAYTNLCGKKLQAKLGGCLNESATSHSPALLSSQQSFAKRQLEKMGWEEGTGLGKRRNGIQEHVKIKQREDEVGLGREKEMAREIGNVWWKDSVGGTLARLQLRQKEKKEKKKKSKSSSSSGKKDDEKKKSKKDKRKKSSKNSSSGSSDDNSSSKEITTTIKTYTDEELFQATGGARFGMRAQRRAEGKWKRTESGSNIVDLEKKAKTSIEWNGRGSALVAGVTVDDGKKAISSSEAATEAFRTTPLISEPNTTKKRKRAADADAKEGNECCDDDVVVDGSGEQGSTREKRKQKKEKKRRKSEKSSKMIREVSPSASEGEEEEDGTANVEECTEISKTSTNGRTENERKKAKKDKKKREK